MKVNLYDETGDVIMDRYYSADVYFYQEREPKEDEINIFDHIEKVIKMREQNRWAEKGWSDGYDETVNLLERLFNCYNKNFREAFGGIKEIRVIHHIDEGFALVYFDKIIFRTQKGIDILFEHVNLTR